MISLLPLYSGWSSAKCASGLAATMSKNSMIQHFVKSYGVTVFKLFFPRYLIPITPHTHKYKFYSQDSNVINDWSVPTLLNKYHCYSRALGLGTLNHIISHINDTTDCYMCYLSNNTDEPLFLHSLDVVSQ